MRVQEHRLEENLGGLLVVVMARMMISVVRFGFGRSKFSAGEEEEKPVGNLHT